MVALMVMTLQTIYINSMTMPLGNYGSIDCRSRYTNFTYVLGSTLNSPSLPIMVMTCLKLGGCLLYAE